MVEIGRRTFSKRYIFDENAPRTNRYSVRGLRKQLRYTEEDMTNALYMPLALYLKREEHNCLIDGEELETFLAIANAQRRSSNHVVDHTPITREQLTTYIYPDVL